MKRSGWVTRYAVSVLWWAAAGWPLAVAHAWPAVVQFAIWGLVGTPVMWVVQDRRWTRLTGWDRQHRTDLLRAARRGEPPADPADRAPLRDMVAAEIREGRGMLWFAGLWPLAVASLLFLPGHRPSPATLIVCLIWYALLATVQLYLVRQLRTRQYRVLSILDGVGPDRGTGRP